MDYQKIINQGCKILKDNNIKSYMLDSELLLSSTLRLDRSKLLVNLDKKIKSKEKKIYFNFINRRKKKNQSPIFLDLKSFGKIILKLIKMF